MIPKIRVLIADDDSCIRKNLRELLSRQETIEPVATVSDGRWALHQLRVHPIDVALLDVAMPAVDGIEVAQKISQFYPDTKVIVFTIFEHEESLKRALQVGANAFLTKDTPLEQLVDVIERVHAGERFFSPKPTSMLVDSYLHQDEPDRGLLDAINKLQPRLKTILDLLLSGYTTDEIAIYLGLTQRTVRAYISQCIQATGCVNRSQLVIRALRSGYRR